MNNRVMIGAGAGLIAVGVIGYVLYQRYREEQQDKKWLADLMAKEMEKDLADKLLNGDPSEKEPEGYLKAEIPYPDEPQSDKGLNKPVPGELTKSLSMSKAAILDPGGYHSEFEVVTPEECLEWYGDMPRFVYEFYPLDNIFLGSNGIRLKDPESVLGANIREKFGQKNDDPDSVYIMNRTAGHIYEVIRLNDQSSNVDLIDEEPTPPPPPTRKRSGSRTRRTKDFESEE